MAFVYRSERSPNKQTMTMGPGTYEVKENTANKSYVSHLGRDGRRVDVTPGILNMG
jgi:hypothetical protein